MACCKSYPFFNSKSQETIILNIIPSGNPQINNSGQVCNVVNDISSEHGLCLILWAIIPRIISVLSWKLFIIHPDIILQSPDSKFISTKKAWELSVDLLWGSGQTLHQNKQSPHAQPIYGKNYLYGKHERLYCYPST